MTLNEIEAAARSRYGERCQAAVEINRLPPPERIAALRALPPRFVAVGRVKVEAIRPENRTTYRRPHLRLAYFVDGQRASRERAAAAL